MDRDSSRLRRLMAVASTCRVKMDRRGKDPAAWFSQHEPASLFPTLGSHYKAPAPHKHCLSNAPHYHVSSKTRGVRVTEGCHEAEMFPVCSGERFCWRWGGEEHGRLMELGSWFHFFVRNDLSFCAKDGRAQGTGEARKLAWWHHQTTERWGQESMRSRLAPAKVPPDH